MTRNFYIALIWAVLSACATTQRSSTSAAEQAVTPPSEAATQKPGVTPAANASVVQAAAPAATPPVSKSSANADQSGPMEFPTATKSEDEQGARDQQAQQVKQKLARQEAEISKARQEQRAQAAQMETQAVQEKEAADQTESKPAGNPAAAPRKEEDALVFPENKSTAQSSAANPPSAPPPSVAQPLEHSVYFSYDDATVLDKYDAMLLDNAAYLRSHPGLDVEVQGNCDERGSREYNLALGARRAETVKRALELGGADGSRIHAISFGKEKPVATGHDEDSWSKDRRADIVY